MDMRDAYRVLEVEIGASRDDVREARNVLVRVWHPDLHQRDGKLHGRANSKVKQINAAYDAIEAAGFPSRSELDLVPLPDDSEPGHRSPAGTSNDGDAKRQAQNPPAQDPSRPAPDSVPPNQASPPRAASPPSPHEPIPPSHHAATAQHTPATTQPSPSTSVSMKFFLFAVVGTVFIYTVSNLESRSRSTTQYQPSSEHSQSPPYSDRATGYASNAAPSIEPDESAKPAQSNDSPPATADEVAPRPRQNPRNRSFFTVGSTRDDVLAVQGTPTEFTENTFKYGLSSVFFRNGKVSSWDVSPLNALKVKLLPSGPVKRGSFFTVGSTKDDVLAVQGTPTEFSGDVFKYGLSSVFFRNDTVTSWDVSPLNPLQAKLLPSAPVEQRGFFTVGSTRNEVLAVQGTPTEFSSDVLKYGLSSVFFRNGTVTSWDVSPLNPLQAKLLPSGPVEQRGFFTVGSTRDEVLAEQGTPTEFSSDVLKYGLSSVFFRDGRVTSWDISPLNPLKAKLTSDQR